MKSPKKRSAAVIIKDDQVLLMHRKNSEFLNAEGMKETREYWVFPGGTVEDGETPEEAVVRELAEETTIVATVDRILYRETITSNGDEYYTFLCTYVSGTPHIREDSPEAAKMATGTQWYEPVWFPLSMIKTLTLYPLDIRDRLIHDAASSFAENPITSIRENLRDN